MAEQIKACINCEHRQLWDAGSRCNLDGRYIGYCATWDEVCKYWKESKRKPGQIEVYTELLKEVSTMYVSTKTAAKMLGLSEYELRRGQKEGRYPALVISGDSVRPTLRWDVDLVRSIIEERMRDTMKREAKLDD